MKFIQKELEPVQNMRFVTVELDTEFTEVLKANGIETTYYNGKCKIRLRCLAEPFY